VFHTRSGKSERSAPSQLVTTHTPQRSAMMNPRNVLVLLLLGAFMLACDASDDKNALRAVKQVEETANIEETMLDAEMMNVDETNGERRLFNFWALMFQSRYTVCEL